MRLTAFTDHGLRALMRMAVEPERAFSTAELAEEFAASRHHLTKIIQRLTEGGLVRTRRGGGGGAMLAREPGEIRLGAVVRLLERDQAMVECFLHDGGACPVVGRCRLRSRLRSAEAAFLEDLDRSSLADIALPPKGDATKAGKVRGLTPDDKGGTEMQPMPTAAPEALAPDARGEDDER